MIINHNLSAMNAQRQMGVNQANATKSMEKLSSGLRINRAGDDAAGLAISEKMRGQIRGLDQANRNAQDGISMIQTAEGALTETHSILQRMRELSVQAANDTNVENDREEIQNELNQLIEEIDRIGNNTEFNTQKLLDGGAAQKVGGTQSIPTAKGTAAVKTGDTALGSSVSFATDVASKPLTLNGENVTLTNVKGLGDTYDAATNIDDVVDALQKDINAVYNGTDHDGVTFTVGKTDDGKITITSSVEGAESKVDLTGTDATAAATLGLKTLDAVKGEDAANAETNSEGFKATLQVGANKGQIFEISIGDMRAEALGLKAPTAGNESTAKGTAAVKTGDTALGSSVSFATDVASKPLTLNGENVTLTNVKGLGDTYDAATNIDDVVDALQKDINAVYNGTDHDGVTFTVGKTDDGKITITSSVEGAESKVDLTGTDATAAATLGLKTLDAVKGEDAANTATTTGIDVSTSKNANEAIETIDKAITAVSAQRSKLGAWQNRLEHTINNLGTSSENLTAAESRVRDVDMAKEMMEMSKNNILQQASQAMLAQANQNPQQVLQLLR